MTDDSLWYFISAIFSAIAIGVQINGFSRTGWELTAKLRKMQFAAVIRHDISWFDEEKNSVSELWAIELMARLDPSLLDFRSSLSEFKDFSV